MRKKVHFANRAFFKAMDRMRLALSYDDVQMFSGYSKVKPADARLETRFSRRINLRIPIVSAAMDTVTKSNMAIAMAKGGGLGILPRNETPEEQAEQVARVKFHWGGYIAKPKTIFGDQTIAEIQAWRKAKQYDFHSFPVVDREGKFIGLLTSKDFLFCNRNQKIRADEAMTKDVITAPAGTELKGAYKIMQRSKKMCLPLVDADRSVCGLFLYMDSDRVIYGNAEGYTIDTNGQLRVGAAVGTGESELERAKLLIESHADVLVIDTAHADTLTVIETLKAIKDAFPSTDVVVGNISQGPSAKRLADAGADGIKVGQGPGSICTTRVVAGIGRPQLTAVFKCAEAIEGSDIPVCADGGISYSGDMAKAFGAGAHNVMLGRLLAGTEESPGEIETIGGRPCKVFRGMGSLGAMQDNEASRLRYGQQESEKDKIVPEGIEGTVPYQGSVTVLLHQYVEGIKRNMGYVGAPDIETLRRIADFDYMSSAGLKESHPHDVDNIRAAPNYNPQGKGN